MSDPILEINDVTKEFTVKSGFFSNKKGDSVRAVSNVSLNIDKGETFGLVGESGCGKTTLGRCIVRGIEPTSGEVIYHQENGQIVDFLKVKRKEYKDVRKDIQMIFQNPFSSLNPRMTVFDIISEPLKVHQKLSKTEIKERVTKMAEKTGLNVSYLKRYPHAFSGGQRQRIGIARALITEPNVIVCDEAVSALDVSIQAQIVNLLKDLQQDLEVTFLFISHDLSIVEHISDRVAVMYLGRIVEIADTQTLFTDPGHPYTEALLSAVPRPDPMKKAERIVLKGEVPNPADPPSGCSFHTRCPYSQEKCRQDVPELQKVGNGHQVACHYANELYLNGITALSS